jgi:hypothetical protein
MKLIVVAAGLLLAIVFVAVTQTQNKAIQELLKANVEYDEALVRGDIVALECVYADESIYTTLTVT